MKELAEQFSIADLCRTLEVSRSGYYRWLQSPASARQVANAKLSVMIDALFEQHRHNYGSPRITQALRQKGMWCNHKRVERLMRVNGRRARQRRRYRVVTTDSKHSNPIAPNQLAGRKVSASNEVWCVDITYVATREGWLYVAGVMDLFSRKIVGWAMGDHLQTSLATAALKMALQHRRPRASVLHHSDRGVQYASQEYRALLSQHDLQASMSRKANCYDNAAMESFWSTLKNELVYQHRYATRAEARRSIFEWIETYYNRVRLHSSLGYKSPVDFENQLN